MKNFKSRKIPVFGFFLLFSLATGAQKMEMKADMPAVVKGGFKLYN